MTTHNAGPVDPFTDPAHGDQISIHDSSTPSSADDSTLVLGRNVSLTLGTDSLVLLGTPFWFLTLSNQLMAQQMQPSLPRNPP